MNGNDKTYNTKTSQLKDSNTKISENLSTKTSKHLEVLTVQRGQTKASRNEKS